MQSINYSFYTQLICIQLHGYTLIYLSPTPTLIGSVALSLSLDLMDFPLIIQFKLLRVTV